MSSLIRRILLLALAGGILFDSLVPGNAAGLNALVVMAAFLVAALAVAGRDGIGRMDPADAWLGPVALVFAAMPVLRADDWLVTADLLFAGALAAGAIGCLAGGRVTRGLVPQVLELAVGVVAAAGVGSGTLLRAPRQNSAGSVDPSRAARVRGRLRRAAPVARGLLIAVPVVVVFAALFASADAVFARLTSDVLAFKPDLDVEDLVIRTLVVTVAAWGAAGLLALSAGVLPAYAPAPASPEALGNRSPGPSDPGAAASAARGSPGPVAPSPAAVAAAGLPPAPPTAPIGFGGSGAASWPLVPDWSASPRPADRPPLRLGATEAATVLVIVDLLFATFVILQLAYLFGGRDTLAMAGLTYAEYARRGFFELVLAAVLAGTLVVTLDLAVAARSRPQLAGALVLLGLTAVVLVSALVRLRLYQEAYGWTELRFIVLTAIGWLGVAIVVTAGLLVQRRTRWTLHVLGILILVTLGGLNVVGPQAFVAERNLERAIDPSLVPQGGRMGLDTGYVSLLGDEAVVPVVDAWNRLAPADRDALAPALAWREEQLRTDPSLQGWPAWNLSRERARAALAAWDKVRGSPAR